jgi:hypothetical protein
MFSSRCEAHKKGQSFKLPKPSYTLKINSQRLIEATGHFLN